VTDQEVMNLLHLDFFLIYQGPFYAQAMFVEKSYIYIFKKKINTSK